MPTLAEPTEAVWPEPGSLASRRLVGELMDDPDLPERDHRRALAGLARLNSLARAAAALFDQFCDPSAAHPAAIPGSCLRVLDAAAGAADVSSAFVRLARQRGIEAHLTCADISPLAMRIARETATRRGIDVTTTRTDLIADGQDPAPTYDCVLNTLLLHHLTTDDAARVLRSLAAQVRPGGILLVADLLRSRRGLLLARTIPRIVTASRVVHTDAVRSVRAAFTRSELRDLCARAGLETAEVTPIFPERAIIRWIRPEAAACAS